MKMEEQLVVAKDFAQWWCPNNLDVRESLEIWMVSIQSNMGKEEEEVEDNKESEVEFADSKSHFVEKLLNNENHHVGIQFVWIVDIESNSDFHISTKQYIRY